MPRKPRPNKRTKRSLAMRKYLANKKSVVPTSSTVEEESIDDIFNRLLHESRSKDHQLTQNQNPEPESDSSEEDPPNLQPLIVEKDNQPTQNKNLEPESDSNDEDPTSLRPLNVENDNQPTPNQNPESYSSDEDPTSLELQPLIVEPYSTEELQNLNEKVIHGRRIVDVEHIFREFQVIASHPLKCTMGKYKLQKETRSGLFCTWTYFCDNCEKTFAITSSPVDEKQNVNDALVWGAMSVGVGYAQLEELFCLLNIPIMSQEKYICHENKVGNAWESILVDKMKENAEEEKKIAIEKGNTFQGKPFITVIGDGGWAKRSYGHGMNSNSGVVLAARGCKTLTLQVGQGKIVPDTEKNGMCIQSFSLKPSISDDISNADLIISHAGAGSCLDVLCAKKPLIVVINEDLMDNHQEELACKLEEEGYLFKSNCKNLLNVLTNLNINSLKPYVPGNPKKYSTYIDNIMGFSN